MTLRSWTLSSTFMIAVTTGLLAAGAGARAQSTNSTPAAPGAPPASMLAEVVVTAQKRSENVQRVPETVTAISGAALAARGVTDLTGITGFTPGAQFNQEGPTTQIFIRGIGQTSDFDTNDPAVAVNVNQVYAPRWTLASALFDVKSIEVLSGPQGTLYGRNAAGGAVNVITNTPGRTFGGNFLLEYGDYNEVHGSAAVDLPVSDDFRLRLAVDAEHHDAYVSNTTNDKSAGAVRLTGLWTPTGRFSALFHIEFEDDHDHGPAIISLPLVKPTKPWYAPVVPGNRPNNIFTDLAANAEFGYDFGNGIKLTYIPGYYNYYFRRNDPVDAPVKYYPDPGRAGNPLAGFGGDLDVFPDHEHQVTNEIRLNGDVPRLKWVAGAYQFYTHSSTAGYSFNVDNPAAFSGGSAQPYAFSTGTTAAHADFTGTSYALYGQATYSLFSWLRITGGLRYSDDHKKTSGSTQEAIPIIGVTLPPSPYSLKLGLTHVDWKLGLEGDLTPTSLVYANVGTGFIDGGFNVNATGAAASFRPETLTSYSLGIKNSFLQNRLHVNDELFHYDYANLQVSALDFGTGNTDIYNVPKSRIWGNQLDIEYRILRDTTITVDVAYLDTRIQKGLLPPAATYSCIPGEKINPAFCAGSGALVNYADLSLPNAPKWSTSLSLTQDWGLGESGSLEGRVATHMESGSWALFSHLDGLYKSAFTRTDLSLTYKPYGHAWSVGIWVKNVENTAHYVTPATSNVYGLNSWLIDSPRTCGIRFTSKFGQ